jgi:hypothetical protein
MREAIDVYDAVCCRTWVMPLEAFHYPSGRCGYCGQVPEPVGNVRTLKIHQPPQYLNPDFKEY